MGRVRQHKTINSSEVENPRSALKNKGVRGQTNNGIGVNIIGHQTLESAVAEGKVMAPAADPMKVVCEAHAHDSKEIDEDVLDLSDGCTRPNKGSPECLHEKFLMQNPIVSGRIVSKLLFSYADIEIKAKLPTGDWLYPELYLEDDNQNRLVIAYARGNKVLTGNDGIDLGGSLLFGGPILSTREPGRSEKLSSTKSTSGTFGESFHTYRLRWTQDSIELFVDGVNFGLINSKSISVFGGSSPKQVRLVLGVGVGGVSDFPDGFKSGTHEKPWKNRNRNQVKTFYAKKEEWFPTWTDNGLLIVDYVRVTSI
ncbi:hypothetical protein JTB14_024768 [Gonioctena quinquepunctata]|nr:hypothetical protein JTB14_024768 [Gonioctena quinquepunctata]